MLCPGLPVTSTRPERLDTAPARNSGRARPGMAMPTTNSSRVVARSGDRSGRPDTGCFRIAVRTEEDAWPGSLWFAPGIGPVKWELPLDPFPGRD